MLDQIVYMFAAFGAVGLVVLVVIAWIVFTNDWSK